MPVEGNIGSDGLDESAVEVIAYARRGPFGRDGVPSCPGLAGVEASNIAAITAVGVMLEQLHRTVEISFWIVDFAFTPDV